jgi:hypothetical protein
MKKDAFYFPHDSNAKDDPKCILLIEQLGLEGYGIYWILIETLRDQPGYCYPLQLLPALARRFNTTFEKIKAVIYSYHLFSIKDEMFFFSQSLCDRMVTMDISREKQRQKALKRWGKEAAALPEHSNGNAKLMPVEDIRVEDIILEEIKAEEKNGDESPTTPKISNNSDDKKEILRKRYRETLGKELKKLYPTPSFEEEEELKKFIAYWAEPNKTLTKMKFELEKTWETGLRVKTWFSRSKSFANKVNFM